MNSNDLKQLLSYLTTRENTLIELSEKDVEFLTQASDVAVCTAETNDVSSDRMKQIIEELNRQIESIADDFFLCLFLMEVNPIHELLVRELQEFSLCWEVSKTMKWGLRMNPQINSLKVTLVFNR